MTPREAVDIIRDAPSLTPHEQAQCADIERQAIDPLRHAPGFPRTIDLGYGLEARVDVLRYSVGNPYIVHLDFRECNLEVFTDGVILTAAEADKLAGAMFAAARAADLLNF